MTENRIGTKIQKIARKEGTTLTNLAIKVGLPRNEFIMGVKKGGLGLTTINKLAKVLNIDPLYLLNDNIHYLDSHNKTNFIEVNGRHIGNKLKGLYKKSGLKQKEIAEKVGISIAQLINIHKMDHVDSKHLVKFAELYNVPVAYFFEKIEERDIIPSNHIGNKLKGLYKKSGLKQNEIARQLNVTPQYLHKIFAKDHIDTKQLLKFAEIFNVPISSFFHPQESYELTISENDIEFLISAMIFSGVDVSRNKALKIIQNFKKLKEVFKKTTKISM